MHFGLPLFEERATIVEPTKLRLLPGQIVAIVGPSGSGKTSLLHRIEQQFAGGCMVSRVRFPEDSAIVDGVVPGASLGEALSILSSCGLGEPRLWLRRFDELSDGERFRARLARAIGRHAQSGSAAPLLCDEFCSILHRRAARAVSFNLRKMVTRRMLSVVLAAGVDDLLVDLQPDVIVRLGTDGGCEVEQRTPRPRRMISFARRLKIEPGRKRDYDAFTAMHYRPSDELGFVDKVFVMREGDGGEPLGIVVYAHPPLELSLRNKVTNRRFSRKPGLLNQCVRILRRLVIHPDVRGCGLGHYLVRKTLPLVGTPYVECLASMGEVNPVFERAGMERIGQYELKPQRREAVEALKTLGVDPNARDFTMHVCRRRRVREIVAGVVYDWYRATTGGGNRRVARQSPQLLAQTFRGLIGTRPVYYLWQRGKRNHRTHV
jgi:ABC-type ATPase with predicted acetyltransferase domain